MDFGSYITELINEVKGLFSSKRQYAAPPQASSSGSGSKPITSPGGYTAPIHSTWHSSGGFTYQPNSTHPKGHMGVDMRCPAGTSVYPLAPGVVSNVGTDPMGGNVVNVQHSGNVRTYYAHLSTARVQKGDKVNTNSILGTVGNTGNASHTFPHLHFQVWKDSQIQDPAHFFSVPPYTNLSAEEQHQGPWLNEQAKQEAQAFNMKEHVAERRVAFSGECDKLLKIARQFSQITKTSSHKRF
jgi:murein DD-endopeptidase MepM/ murein hydrolase activator NlpD